MGAHASQSGQAAALAADASGENRLKWQRNGELTHRVCAKLGIPLGAVVTNQAAVAAAMLEGALRSVKTAAAAAGAGGMLGAPLAVSMGGGVGSPRTPMGMTVAQQAGSAIVAAAQQLIPSLAGPGLGNTSTNPAVAAGNAISAAAAALQPHMLHSVHAPSPAAHAHAMGEGGGANNGPAQTSTPKHQVMHGGGGPVGRSMGSPHSNLDVLAEVASVKKENADHGATGPVLGNTGQAPLLMTIDEGSGDEGGAATAGNTGTPGRGARGRAAAAAAAASTPASTGSKGKGAGGRRSSRAAAAAVAEAAAAAEATGEVQGEGQEAQKPSGGRSTRERGAGGGSRSSVQEMRSSILSRIDQDLTGAGAGKGAAAQVQAVLGNPAPGLAVTTSTAGDPTGLHAIAAAAAAVSKASGKDQHGDGVGSPGCIITNPSVLGSPAAKQLV